MVEHLVRKIAKHEDVNAGEDPSQWFRGRFNREPQYEHLLEALAPTQLERQRLLAELFELEQANDGGPDKQGRREPSPAHRALADLVASGHIRVILPLNLRPPDRNSPA